MSPLLPFVSNSQQQSFFLVFHPVSSISIACFNSCEMQFVSFLQCTSLAFDEVDEDNVYTCTGQPLRSDIQSIVNSMLNEDFTTSYDSILIRMKPPILILILPGVPYFHKGFI